MHGSWFLFCVLVYAGNLIEGWMQQEAPTCEQLRAFWDTVSRSVKISELTNEIPLVPWDVVPFSPESYRQKERKKPLKPGYIKHKDIMKDILFEGGTSPVLSPKAFHSLPAQPEPISFHSSEPHQPSNHEINGIFGGFAEDGPKFGEWAEDSSFLNTPMGTRKKGGLGTMHEPAWGLPEDVGLFGKFVDFEDGLPLMSPQQQSPVKFNKPRHDAVPSEEFLTTKESCNQVENKHCILDGECACSGWNHLFCLHGRCHSPYSNNGKVNKFGYWHDEALPSSKLGFIKRLQRRSTQSIFM